MKKLILCAFSAFCVLFLNACVSHSNRLNEDEEVKLLIKMSEDSLAVYKKYCDEGFAPGCLSASKLLEKFKDQEKRKMAFDYLIKACESGDYVSCKEVAKIYSGRGHNKKIKHVSYEPEKIMYYLRKACEFGECSQLYNVLNGHEAYVAWDFDDGFGSYLKIDDALKYINIDEYVQADFALCIKDAKQFTDYGWKSKEESNVRCYLNAAKYYLLGSAQQNHQEIGKGQDLKKAKEYLSKIKIEIYRDSDTYFYSLVKEVKSFAKPLEVIKSIIKEKCAAKERDACEFYEREFNKKDDF